MAQSLIDFIPRMNALNKILADLQASAKTDARNVTTLSHEVDIQFNGITSIVAAVNALYAVVPIIITALSSVINVLTAKTFYPGQTHTNYEMGLLSALYEIEGILYSSTMFGGINKAYQDGNLMDFILTTDLQVQQLWLNNVLVPDYNHYVNPPVQGTSSNIALPPTAPGPLLSSSNAEAAALFTGANLSVPLSSAATSGVTMTIAGTSLSNVVIDLIYVPLPDMISLDAAKLSMENLPVLSATGVVLNSAAPPTF